LGTFQNLLANFYRKLNCGTFNHTSCNSTSYRALRSFQQFAFGLFRSRFDTQHPFD